MLILMQLLNCATLLHRTNRSVIEKKIKKTNKIIYPIAYLSDQTLDNCVPSVELLE